MKLLTLKSNSARHLHCCEVGAVPLKPMELQWQKSDLTKQDLACRTSFLIYVKHECNILITIHCINYWKSIKAWQIFRCNWKHEMWHWSPESCLFLFLIEITRIGKKNTLLKMQIFPAYDCEIPVPSSHSDCKEKSPLIIPHLSFFWTPVIWNH